MGRRLYVLVILLQALVAGACTASAVEVAPPRYDLYFPTGMAISPDERYLFVLNANSDLRYSHGTVQVFDLQRIDDLANGWTSSQAVGPECQPVAGRPRVLGCPLTLDSGQPSAVLVSPSAVIGVGNFGVDLGVQQLNRGDGKNVMRVFTTVRGDPSVTWMDFDADAGTLTCGNTGSFPRCDQGHRLARRRNDAELPPLPQEPFNVFVDSAGEHVFVSHLTSGFVSLISAPGDGGEPIIQDTIVSLFAPSRLSGTTGSAGLAVRLPGEPGGLVYVTSTRESRVATVAVVDGPIDVNGLPSEILVRTNAFFLNGLDSSTIEGDARGIVFSPDGNRAFIVNRMPPSLQVYDTTSGPAGPRNQWLGGIEICDQPANLAVADFGAGTRVAIPCFANGQLWILDPITFRLLDVEDAGRGPSGVVASTLRKKIYVGNYAEDTLSIIDATPGSVTQNRMVLRLGTVRKVEALN